MRRIPLDFLFFFIFLEKNATLHQNMYQENIRKHASSSEKHHKVH